MSGTGLGRSAVASCLFVAFLIVPLRGFAQTAVSTPPRLSLASVDFSSSLRDEAPTDAGSRRFSELTLLPTIKQFDAGYTDPADVKPPERVKPICTAEDPHARACRYHWRAAFEESAAFLGIEIAGYLKIDKGTWGVVKQDFDNGDFWSNYFKTLENFRYNHWNDDDAWRTTWIGHPMSGSFVEFIWIQNAPKAAGLKYGKSWPYWKSRFLAMIPSAIYSAQWLLGPVSESSFGNEGLYYYINHAGKYSNGTGYCDLVVTPFGGLLWSVAEDLADLHFASKIRARTRNPFLLFASSFITPTKSGANLLRLKAPWYRDPDYSSYPSPGANQPGYSSPLN